MKGVGEIQATFPLQRTMVPGSQAHIHARILNQNEVTFEQFYGI